MPPESKAVLISVHPKYIRKIVDGSKRVEFRRVWAAESVTHLVLYSTSPEMRVVGVSEIKKSIKGNVATLWDFARQYGGGITRKSLRDYFSGTSKGYALLLGDIKLLEEPLILADVIPGMRPPQSYVYLSNEQFEHVLTLIS